MTLALQILGCVLVLAGLTWGCTAPVGHWRAPYPARVRARPSRTRRRPRR